MSSVVDQLQTLDEHAIDVDFHCLVEHLVDETLVGDPRILETKGHDPVEIQDSVHQE